jgi:hypothetical protein
VSGVTADVAFEITCPAAARIRVSVAATGVDPDLNYQVAISSACAGCAPSGLAVGAFLEFIQPPGTYIISLYYVAANCSVNGANPVSVTAVGGATANVTFSVTCSAMPLPPPNGVVRITAPTTGTNPDASYGAVNETWCDFWYGCWEQLFSAASVVEFTVPYGSYVFRLTDVAANCSVSVPNPATVIVQANTTTELVFPVSCR